MSLVPVAIAVKVKVQFQFKFKFKFASCNGRVGPWEYFASTVGVMALHHLAF